MLSEAGSLDRAQTLNSLSTERCLPMIRSVVSRARRVTGREAGSSRGMVTYWAYVGLDVHRALAEGDDVCNGGFGTFVASGGAVWQVLHKAGTDPTFVDPYLASLSGGASAHDQHDLLQLGGGSDSRLVVVHTGSHHFRSEFYYPAR